MRRLKGSLSIEAILSMSMMLVILTLILGTLLSVYIDENVQWSVLQTKDDLSLAFMPFYGHDKFLEQILEQAVLTVIAEHKLDENIKNRDMSQLINHVKVTPIHNDSMGFLQLEVSYKYLLPGLFAKGEMVIPSVAAAVSDGVDFSSEMVYITTYGEKYHQSNCFHLRKSKFGIDRSEAIDKGYEACKNCHNQSERED